MIDKVPLPFPVPLIMCSTGYTKICEDLLGAAYDKDKLCWWTKHHGTSNTTEINESLWISHYLKASSSHPWLLSPSHQTVTHFFIYHTLTKAIFTKWRKKKSSYRQLRQLSLACRKKGWKTVCPPGCGQSNSPARSCSRLILVLMQSHWPANERRYTDCRKKQESGECFCPW